MKLKQVSVSKLHGIFTKRIGLSDDYTFIHGINGTGKTSILKAMQAILEPDLEWIATAKYDSISVQIEEKGEKIHFRFSRSGSNIIVKSRIGNSHEMEEYDIQRIDFIFDNFSRRDVNNDVDRSVLRNAVFEIFSQSEIIKKIQSIPTPIFLGLNRTSSFDADFDQMALRAHRQRRPSTVAITHNADDLSQGLQQALALIARSTRRINQRRRLLEDTLRNDISFLLFTNPLNKDTRHIRTWPERADLLKFRKMKKEIPETWKRIGFNFSAQQEIETFFDDLLKLTRQLAQYSSFHKAIEGLSDAESSRLISEWFERRPIIRLIERYFHLIEEFNKKDSALRREITKFEKIINSFFADSGKNVTISASGDVKISIANKDFDIFYLSSGEKQIFVLLSHLIFNPLLSKANVLVIDEPELSLHVRWQEIFVESITTANALTQLILATHSPSIVLDRKNKMVDLNGA